MKVSNKNISVFAITAVLMISLIAFSCKTKQKTNSGNNVALMEAEKPQVDSSRVIALVDLYRAKRYESFQDARAAGPENVYKISLYGREIGELPAEIGDFAYLATLDVSYNELSNLPDALADLHYLQGFYAKGNRLSEFPQQIMLLPLLERLNLSENQLTEIPAQIARMDQLTSLNLAKNGITRIPADLYALTELRILDLAENGFMDLPEGLGQMRSLKKLDISKNQLKKVPRELTALAGHLEELSLQGNQIPQEEIDWLVEAMPSTKIRF